MSYRKGYFKAMLDIFKFMESMSSGSLMKPVEAFRVTIAVLKDVLENHKLDYFMENGGDIEFKYRYEKGKVIFMEVGEIERTESKETEER